MVFVCWCFCYFSDWADCITSISRGSLIDGGVVRHSALCAWCCDFHYAVEYGLSHEASKVMLFPLCKCQGSKHGLKAS